MNSRFRLPALSVVMPVRNALPFLDDAVSSIIGQSFADFEFIVGDDASTDGSREALRSWARKDDRIRLFESVEQLGPVRSSNWVASKARAPLIARMDADDVAHPDRLRRQIEVLKKSPNFVLLGTLCDCIDARGVRIRAADLWRLTQAARTAPFAHPSTMVRRCAFEQIGGYRLGSEYWEDLDLYLRLAEIGRVGVLPDVLLSYRYAHSARIELEQARLEQAIDRMHRCLDAYSKGADYTQLLTDEMPNDNQQRLPRTFVSLGNLRLWSGHRPAVLRHMWNRAHLSWDAATLGSLVWGLWASLSPASLRVFLKALTRVRNVAARRRTAGVQVFEWRPKVPGIVACRCQSTVLGTADP